MTPPPIFTSTPSLLASEGIAYGYTLTATDPAGGMVNFALSSSPTGASLSGNSLTWTPAAVQSRLANAFTITATTSEGGSATQSWSLTPNGTIRGSWINTHWTSSGSTNVPVDLTRLVQPPQALIPQMDGSFVAQPGSGNPDGTFTIPGVPGGFYWLQIGARSFWTSSSTFDNGFDEVGGSISTTPTVETTTFNFDISGLDPVVSGDEFAFLTDLADPFQIGFTILAPTGATSMTRSFALNSNIDYSKVTTGYLLQYESVSAGSVTGLALGPELTVSTLSLTSGTTNNVSGVLHPSPATSFDLSVKGSEWAPMFQSAAPVPVTPVTASIDIFAQAYAPANVLAVESPFSVNLPIFLPPLLLNGGFLPFFQRAGTCSGDVGISSFSPITSYPPMLTDQDFGTLSYGDPFDPSWAKTFSLCQTGSVQVPEPPGTQATFLFTDGVNTAIPSAPVTPLAFPVVNPMIDGASLFTVSTVNPTGVTLSWSAPSSGAKPFAYKATLFAWGTRPDGSMGYLEHGAFFTGQTSMALPPLQPSTTYVIALTTEVDARANVGSSPNRSGLPTAIASVISAPITTNAGAAAPMH